MGKLSKLEMNPMQTPSVRNHLYLRLLKILILLGLASAAFYLFTQANIKELIVIYTLFICHHYQILQ